MPRAMILKADFVLWPIDLEKAPTEVREFYRKLSTLLFEE